MAATKQCPQCRHVNLERAVYCFQCGYRLEQLDSNQTPPHATRRSQRIVEIMWEPPETNVAERPPAPAGTALLSELHLEEPLTCLSCGALNRPNAYFCTSCGAALLLSEGEIGLMSRVSARSDVGQVRENNEDSIGLWAIEGMLLALVADGMGGAVAGEEASRLTVEAVQADFVGEERGGHGLLALAEELIIDKLAEAIQSANQAVIDRVDEDTRLRGMGTTATLAYIYGRRAIVAHVGDSRAYLVDGEQGWINQITSDHSFVEALLSAGHITEEQAADHPMKNVLYRALGQTPDTTADMYDRYLKPGDRIVLCSDGLTRHVQPQEIAQVVLDEVRPDDATRHLIDLANARGGEDNVSIVVIRMDATRDATTELRAISEERLKARNSETGILPSPEIADPGDAEQTLTKPPDAHLKMLRALGFGGEDSHDPDADFNKEA